MGKTYGVRFDLWTGGALEPRMVIFEKEEPPTEQEIAECVKEKAKEKEAALFGSESAEAEIRVEYRSGVADDQELWGCDPGFGVICQEVELPPQE
ncbi:MAG: hypothetical protein ACE5EP_02480 [Candidatus Methylomirabilales bacterium]